jgi:hypothetical protein
MRDFSYFLPPVSFLPFLGLGLCQESFLSVHGVLGEMRVLRGERERDMEMYHISDFKELVTNATFRRLKSVC